MPSGAESCPACGGRVADSTQQRTNGSRPGISQRRAIYAGFWLRGIALAVDLLILGIALGPTVFEPIFRKNQVGTSFRDILQFYSGGTRQALALILLLHLILWLYFAAFESSRWQATPGKKLLGVMVCDLNGQRISFARATGRYFGKLISQFFMIGYLMAGFTRRKQAFHDMLAGCLVLRMRQGA